MSLYLSLAFACHFIGILTMTGFGFVYLLRKQFMPYHGVALGQEWRDVPKPVQVLTLALMRAVAGATLALAALTAVVLLIPFRGGEPWALWAVPISGFVVSAGSLYAMRLVAANTPANPPFLPVIVGLGLGIVGLALSVVPIAP